MAKHNAAYVMNTVDQATVNQTPDDREPAENVRYFNFWNVVGTRFKMGYPNKFGKIMSPSITVSHPNQARVIEKLDAEPAKVDSFLQNVIVGKYNAGKGEHLGAHFIEVCMLSVKGNLHQFGSCRFEEDDPRHADIIEALKEDPESATAILRACEIDYSSAVPVVHDYEF